MFLCWGLASRKIVFLLLVFFEVFRPLLCTGELHKHARFCYLQLLIFHHK